jgi:hypothetical protein
VDSGFPWWLQVQHFLNMFFMLFIMRAGLQILADHPRLYWRRDCTPGTDWPVSGSGAQRPHLDGQGRLRNVAELARYSGVTPLAGAGAMVAFLRQSVVADQRCCLLRTAVCDRSVAEACAGDVGGVSGRTFDGDPICLAELSRR